MRLVNFSDLESLVGQEVGVSPWHEITQSQVNKFADATGDHQWIHVDVERATREIGSPIAHGYLTLSLLPMLAAQVMRVENVQRGINFGCNKVRFTCAGHLGKAFSPHDFIVWALGRITSPMTTSRQMLRVEQV